jgi:hypothetical protein
MVVHRQYSGRFLNWPTIFCGSRAGKTQRA